MECSVLVFAYDVSRAKERFGMRKRGLRIPKGSAKREGHYRKESGVDAALKNE